MKKVLIDTNFILRFLLGDIPSQAKKAKKLFVAIEKEKTEGIISLLVINELIWILEHFYKQKRQDYLLHIIQLLSLKKIKILEVKKMFLMKILEEMKAVNLDFTDLYLVFLAKEKNYFLKSFDKKLLLKIS